MWRVALAHFALPPHHTRRDGWVHPAARAASRRARAGKHPFPPAAPSSGTDRLPTSNATSFQRDSSTGSAGDMNPEATSRPVIFFNASAAVYCSLDG